PDYNPIEHLWKNMKKRTTHNRYWPAWGARRRPPSSPICSVSSAPHLLPLWQASLSFVLLPQIVRARSALMRPESTRNGQRYDGAVDRSDGTTAQKDSGR